MISLKRLLYSILYVFDSFGVWSSKYYCYLQDKDLKLWSHLIKMILLKAFLQIPLKFTFLQTLYFQWWWYPLYLLWHLSSMWYSQGLNKPSICRKYWNCAFRIATVKLVKAHNKYFRYKGRLVVSLNLFVHHIKSTYINFRPGIFLRGDCSLIILELPWQGRFF